MKCPICGYLSFDPVEVCSRCGALLRAESGSPAAAVAWFFGEDSGPGDSRQLHPEEAERSDRRPGSTPIAEDPAKETTPEERPGFQIEDLTADECLEIENSPREPLPDDPAMNRETLLPNETAGTYFNLPGWGDGTGAGVSPIIDQEDEIPDRFWAPEIVGLGRRAVAALIDQALLALVLGLFFLGAAVALWLSGFDEGHLLQPAGLQAALPPFALLAALLSLGYHVFFHSRRGQTPGKALMGIEVRSGEEDVPSVRQATWRWFAAALGLTCAGVGLLWALFEPRRRGWADLLSKTTLAEARPADSGAFGER